MSEDFQDDFAFEAADDAADEGLSLLLDIDGYEGPLHLLLELARKQKVDLAKISILELAEQYIAFIKNATDLRIELAADYLVMASWLAYLKSRLILPKESEEKALPEADELAAHLAFRLQRLEAMRRAADGLFRLPMTGQSVFVHGMAVGLRSRTTPLYSAELLDILKAYGDSRSKTTIGNYKLPRLKVMSLEDARDRLRRVILAMADTDTDWAILETLLPMPHDLEEEVPSRSIRASSLLAGLELAKEGDIEMRQSGVFTPIYVRKAQLGHSPNVDPVNEHSKSKTREDETP